MKRGCAFGYVRTAVKDDSGEKLQQQKDSIIQYCNNKKLDLIIIFEDNGASGASFDRPGWTAMEIALEENKQIRFLIASDYSRISRNAFEGLNKIRLFKKKYQMETKITRNSNRNLLKIQLRKNKNGPKR